jgi:ssDNA-binding Zn-finger/Zn-ribbon topoisomerase 1
MNRTIEIKCSNCGALNVIRESDLVSGVPIKDANGKVVEEHPPVTIDENTVVACDKCRYPMSCKNARVLN